jgi:hypothetical protein
MGHETQKIGHMKIMQCCNSQQELSNSFSNKCIKIERVQIKKKKPKI